MGRDKAWLTVQGEPLVARVVGLVLPLASEILISTNDVAAFDPFLSALPVPARAVPDRYSGAGPLAGLHAGLAASRTDLLVALAVDMPFADQRLLRFLLSLASGHDAVIPLVPPASPTPVLTAPEAEPIDPASQHLKARALPEPLHAVYRKSCLPGIEQRLSTGHRRLVSFLPDVRVRAVMPDEIAQIDPTFRSFRNINTLEDYQQLIARLENT